MEKYILITTTCIQLYQIWLAFTFTRFNQVDKWRKEKSSKQHNYIYNVKNKLNQDEFPNAIRTETKWTQNTYLKKERGTAKAWIGSHQFSNVKQVNKDCNNIYVEWQRPSHKTCTARVEMIVVYTSKGTWIIILIYKHLKEN